MGRRADAVLLLPEHRHSRVQGRREAPNPRRASSRQTVSANRYKPTPTIIDGARHLYANHSVADIVRTEADYRNLSDTARRVEALSSGSVPNASAPVRWSGQNEAVWFRQSLWQLARSELVLSN